jgi:hypothetical protein
METEIAVSTTLAEGPFSEEHIATMAEWAAEDGLDFPDTPATEAKQVEPAADAFGGLVVPTAYNFPAPPANLEPMTVQEQLEVRQVLAESGIPVSIGDQVAKLWNSALAEPSDAAALELGRLEIAAKLRQSHGDEAEEIIRLARAEVQRICLRLPWVHDVLAGTSLGNNEWLIQSLANIGRARKENS